MLRLLLDSRSYPFFVHVYAILLEKKKMVSSVDVKGKGVDRGSYKGMLWLPIMEGGLLTFVVDKSVGYNNRPSLKKGGSSKKAAAEASVKRDRRQLDIRAFLSRLPEERGMFFYEGMSFAQSSTSGGDGSVVGGSSTSGDSDYSSCSDVEGAVGEQSGGCSCECHGDTSQDDGLVCVKCQCSFDV